MLWGHAVVVAWVFAFLICVAVIEASVTRGERGRMRIALNPHHVSAAVLFVGASVVMVLAVGLAGPTILMQLR